MSFLSRAPGDALAPESRLGPCLSDERQAQCDSPGAFCLRVSPAPLRTEKPRRPAAPTARLGPPPFLCSQAAPCTLEGAGREGGLLRGRSAGEVTRGSGAPDPHGGRQRGRLAHAPGEAAAPHSRLGPVRRCPPPPPPGRKLPLRTGPQAPPPRARLVGENSRARSPGRERPRAL